MSTLRKTKLDFKPVGAMDQPAMDIKDYEARIIKKALEDDIKARMPDKDQNPSGIDNTTTGNKIMQTIKDLAKDPRTYSTLANIGSIYAATQDDPTTASALSEVASRIDTGIQEKQAAEATVEAERIKAEADADQAAKDRAAEIETAKLEKETQELINIQQLRTDEDATKVGFLKQGYKEIIDPLKQENIPDRFLIEVPGAAGKTLTFVNQKALDTRKKEVQKEVAYNKNVLKKNQNIKENIDKLIRQNEQGTWELTDLGKYLAVNPVLQRAYRAGGLKAQRDADAAKDFIISNLTLDRLQQIRENSPTGGSLGNVSDKDIQLLKSAALALREGQTEEAIAQALGSLSVELDKLSTKAIIDPRQLLFSDPFVKETIQTGTTQTDVPYRGRQ
jgi:hypothetical protein